MIVYLNDQKYEDSVSSILLRSLKDNSLTCIKTGHCTAVLQGIILQIDNKSVNMQSLINVSNNIINIYTY